MNWHRTLNIAAQVLSAGICVADCIVRFAHFRRQANWTSLCFSLYLLAAAFAFVCNEFSLFRFELWFNFLNYAWGKQMVYFMLGFLMVSSGASLHYVEILFGVYFIFMGVLFLVISCVKRQEDTVVVTQKLELANQKRGAAKSGNQGA